MQTLRNGLLLVLVLFSVFTVGAEGKKSTFKIANLYEQFVDADYSTLDLPQYSQTIVIKAFVLSAEKSLFDNDEKVIVSVSSEADGDEMARLVFDSSVSLDKFKEGEPITVEGVMGFASGTDYIPFTDCKLK